MLNRSLLIAVLSLTPIAASAQAPAVPGGSLLAQLLGERAAAQRWIEHRSAEGGYRIEMPGALKASSEPRELVDGRSTTIATVEAIKGAMKFQASHAAFPAGYLPADRWRVLERMRDGTIEDGTLVRQRRLSMSGLPGLEYVMLDEGRYAVLRGTVVGDVVYHIGVFGGRNADVDKDPDVRRFLDSFTLASSFSLR